MTNVKRMLERQLTPSERQDVERRIATAERKARELKQQLKATNYEIHMLRKKL